MIRMLWRKLFTATWPKVIRYYCEKSRVPFQLHLRQCFRRVQIDSSFHQCKAKSKNIHSPNHDIKTVFRLSSDIQPSKLKQIKSNNFQVLLEWYHSVQFFLTLRLGFYRFTSNVSIWGIWLFDFHYWSWKYQDFSRYFSSLVESQNL